MAKRKQKKPKVEPQLHPEPHPEPKPNKLLANQPFTKKQALIAIGVVAVVGAIILIKIFAATGAQTINFAPTDDAFVSKGAPTTNYGSSTNLSVVAGSGRKDSLLKFTVANLPAGKITGATLWLYVTNGSGNGGNVYLADPNWSQNSVTWATKPALVGTSTTGAAFSENTATKPTTTTSYTVIGKAGAVTAGYWKQVNVGSVVKSNGTYSFRVITGSTNNAVYASNESAHSPKLAVTVDVAADTTPPTAPVLSGYAVSGTLADLSWGDSTDNVGVASYDIYRNGTLIFSGNNPSTTIPVTATTDSFTVVAKDAVGNVSPSSNAITLKANPIDPTDHTYTTPEGTKIEINTNSGFTYDSIYRMLKDNAYPGDYAAIAKTLTIRVQDVLPSQVTSACNTIAGNLSVTSTLYLEGGSSTFVAAPDAILVHEYGHVWTLYHYCLDQHSSFASYTNTRWDAPDGSTVIGTDSRLGQTYKWDPAEIIAEDYRMLFGTPFAQAELSKPMNTDIADPRTQPDLKDWFLNVWAVKQPNG